jgi:hypothetical protein
MGLARFTLKSGRQVHAGGTAAWKEQRAKRYVGTLLVVMDAVNGPLRAKPEGTPAPSHRPTGGLMVLMS